MKNQQKKLLLIVALIAVLGAGAMMIVMPTIKALSTNWQALQTAKSELESTSSQKEALLAELESYKNRNVIPKGIILRPYSPTAYDKSIKIMLDAVVDLAAQNGNLLISLEPASSLENVGGSPAPPPPQPKAEPAPPETAPAEVAADGAATGDAATAAAPPPPPETLLLPYGYRLAVRGSYENILDFLKAVAALKELIEIKSISIENELMPGGVPPNPSEQGAGSTPVVAALTNPQKPLKLMAFIQLYLVDSASHLPASLMTKPEAVVQ
ncbi:MAG: hypothetical protein VKJ06_01875 [Vampirovibrionales bacterium]|nr:hypothetical protein [Vampirovibrionales bacterium]